MYFHSKQTKSALEVENRFTDTNSIIAEIHNIKKRMPIILKPEDEQNLLNHNPYQDFAYPYETNLYAKKSDSNINLLF
jgi:putative SOS response-associated peptidase YedK